MPAALTGCIIMETVNSYGKVDRVWCSGEVTTGRLYRCACQYREATGVDFRQFDGDLEAARTAGAEAVKKADAGPAATRAIAGTAALDAVRALLLHICALHAEQNTLLHAEHITLQRVQA